MEKLRVVIASDKEKVGLREYLKYHIEGTQEVEVIHLSRLKTSRIRSEITKQNPDLVLVTASMASPEETSELRGFVRKVKKHLPQTKIVVQAPRPFDDQMEEILQAGADAWIDERLAYEFLGSTLEKIARGQEVIHLMVRQKSSQS